MAKRKTYGFSMNRLLGITDVKRKIAKTTHIPTTKHGRRNKARRLVAGGCLPFVLMLLLCLAGAVAAVICLL